MKTASPTTISCYPRCALFGEDTMDAGMASVLIAGLLTPFVAYGTAGIWKYWQRSRPVDPKAILAERYARGEIDDQEYTRRLSMLAFGPPIGIDYPLLSGSNDNDR
jgi:hypothetical protein